MPSQPFSMLATTSEISACPIVDALKTRNLFPLRIVLFFTEVIFSCDIGEIVIFVATYYKVVLVPDVSIFTSLRVFETPNKIPYQPSFQKSGLLPPNFRIILASSPTFSSTQRFVPSSQLGRFGTVILFHLRKYVLTFAGVAF